MKINIGKHAYQKGFGIAWVFYRKIYGCLILEFWHWYIDFVFLNK